MLYGPGNARGASVVDVEARRTIERTMCVDTESGEVTRFVMPLRLNWDGSEVETVTERYRSIHTICAGSDQPVLFHCYGRIS